jgi:hypothetical protein
VDGKNQQIFMKNFAFFVYLRCARRARLAPSVKIIDFCQRYSVRILVSHPLCYRGAGQRTIDAGVMSGQYSILFFSKTKTKKS